MFTCVELFNESMLITASKQMCFHFEEEGILLMLLLRRRSASVLCVSPISRNKKNQIIKMILLRFWSMLWPKYRPALVYQSRRRHVHLEHVHRLTVKVRFLIFQTHTSQSLDTFVEICVVKTVNCTRALSKLTHFVWKGSNTHKNI